MSTQNFKIKNGLSIGENEIIDSQGNLTLPEGASIQVGGAPLDALPDQADNSGKYLTTDGSGASWETITQYTPPTNQGAGNFLSGDGTYKTVTVPTAVSQLTNDSGYQTSSQVANTVASLVDSAPTTLDTLNELAAALGDDPNFATTVSTNIGNVSSNVNTHIANTSNPHSVTAAQVGLGNVTNESKATMFTSPTFTGTVSGVTASMVGLGNVENKSSATIRGEITNSNVTTALGYTPYNSTNPSGYITGITSGMVTTALGFTPYNATNPSGFITSSASITGNAATATKLQTARTLTIGSTGKTFDGSANVAWSLAEMGAQAASTAITTSNIGSQSVSYASSAGNADTLDGNHASAFYLATNPSGYTTNTGTVTSVSLTTPTGLSISGSPITTSGTLALTYAAGYVGYTTTEQTKLSGIATGATANIGTVTSVGGTGSYGGLTLSGTVTTSGNLTLGGTPTGTWPISVTGNAATATTLQTARTINGVSFNGSANITITAAANGGNADTLDGNHASAFQATLVSGTNIKTVDGNSLLGSGDISISGATGGGSDAIFFENDTIITANYTITTGKNAMTAGPVTVANGIIVTVPDGSVWTIV